MKRESIEVVIGFLDAVRRRNRRAAARFLADDVVWRGAIPEALCRSSDEVLSIFIQRRGEEIEILGLEVIGGEAGAVFAFERPEPEPGEERAVFGTVYHVCSIADGRITQMVDHTDRAAAVAALNAD